LHRWQEQTDQDADDGDNHQQLNQGKSGSKSFRHYKALKKK
jgi:hypothetical protein